MEKAQSPAVGLISTKQHADAVSNNSGVKCPSLGPCGTPFIIILILNKVSGSNLGLSFCGEHALLVSAWVPSGGVLRLPRNLQKHVAGV